MSNFDGTMTRLLDASAEIGPPPDSPDSCMPEHLDDPVKATLAAVRDIRKSADRIVHEIHRQVVCSPYAFSMLTSLLGDPCVLTDQQYRVIALNKAARALFKMDEGHAVGGSPLDNLIGRVCVGGSVRLRELAVPNSTGTLNLYEVSDSPAQAGESSFRVVTFREVTVRRMLDNHNVELTAFQSMLLSQVPVPLFYTNTQGSDLRGSDSFYDLLGKPKEVVRGMSVSAFIVGPELKFDGSEQTLAPLRLEVTAISRGGPIPAALMRNPLISNASCEGYVCTLLPLRNKLEPIQ